MKVDFIYLFILKFIQSPYALITYLIALVFYLFDLSVLRGCGS